MHRPFAPAVTFPGICFTKMFAYMHKNLFLRCLFIQQRPLEPTFRASTVLDTRNRELPVLSKITTGRKEDKHTER